MILIADSGATKTEWALVSREGDKLYGFFSQGYNPNYIGTEEIAADLRSSLPEGFPADRVEEIYFYGAGVTELHTALLRDFLTGIFPNVDVVFTARDLLGAARALLGHSRGFAAILGTGTNSCIYDGEKDVYNVSSLGFILGDEGSGAYIGKKMICDYMRADMPGEVSEMVGRLLGKSSSELIAQIYTKPFPNRYCAQYCSFISENLGTHPYFYALVLSCFRDFFSNIVSHYPDYTRYRFNCVGSVGYYFKNILERVAQEYGMEVGTILKTPMEGLIRYHGGQRMG
ncbi:MAG: N-acetylglucosamine kinase [Bacteroidales bacterium]|nr:N-acetylglucosamine kinase [Bacteroidales bacterium]